MEVGGEGDRYTYRYTVTTRMTSALRWAAMRAILMFNNFTRQCPQTTTLEVKGVPKQIRTEVPLLTARPNRLTKRANFSLKDCTYSKFKVRDQKLKVSTQKHPQPHRHVLAKQPGS